eukprot:CAMPEP_0119293050 /NCGR_PEP_ID=MMETSP1329-20130426/45323_1 /TAXON_ID=114041 /ORGANISM="Genus nov. species nov., Strain RCC1024" /LENGTH=125 /DNA_ID=CAMNT_0007293909 /DNA_START=208 /DNA_END=581 /DNA_ORIENTATION=+
MSEVAWGLLRRVVAPAASQHPQTIILSAATVYVGRRPESDAPLDASAALVQLGEPRLSKVHCVLRVDANGVTVERRATNAVFVNGLEIQPHRRAALTPGDALGLLANDRRTGAGAITYEFASAVG